MRIENNGTRYYSFAELAGAMGLKPVSKVTNDKEKLESQKNKFVSRHKCKSCGEPMTWVGGNIMACTNPKCKGIKHVSKNSDGSENVWYETSFDMLDELGTEIAGNIFSAEI